MRSEFAETFTMLMGDLVLPRKCFIQTHTHLGVGWLVGIALISVGFHKN